MEQSLCAFKPPQPQDFAVPEGAMSIQQVALLLGKLLVRLRSGSGATAPEVEDILCQLRSVQDAPLLSPQSTECQTTAVAAALLQVQEALQQAESQISQTSDSVGCTGIVGTSLTVVDVRF